jgi:hypothetical protein
LSTSAGGGAARGGASARERAAAYGSYASGVAGRTGNTPRSSTSARPVVRK